MSQEIPMRTAWLVAVLLASGCDGSAPPSPRPGKGGTLMAALTNTSASNVDDNAYLGVSEGGAESVGGDYLEIDTSMAVSNDLTQGISVRINESSFNRYYWMPAVGPIALGKTSAVTLHYTETYVSDSGAYFRYWTASGGVLNITALSKAMVSFTIQDAVMMPDSSAAKGSFTLNGTGTNLVF